jgi:hypothetical protein
MTIETSLLKWIRDEIREIAPGTYLGKVYWGKKRLIDFVLEFPATLTLTLTPFAVTPQSHFGRGPDRHGQGD